MKREITAIYLLPGKLTIHAIPILLYFVLILYSVICTRQRDQPLVGTKIKAVTHKRGSCVGTLQAPSTSFSYYV